MTYRTSTRDHPEGSSDPHIMSFDVPPEMGKPRGADERRGSKKSTVPADGQ